MLFRSLVDWRKQGRDMVRIRREITANQLFYNPRLDDPKNEFNKSRNPSDLPRLFASRDRSRDVYN